MGARRRAQAFEAEAFWISACMMPLQTRLNKAVGLLRIGYAANIISASTLAHVKTMITISFQWTKTFLLLLLFLKLTFKVFNVT